jgi:hypothetical protein
MSRSRGSTQGGPATTFDRAVHLFGKDPWFWWTRGLLPSVPVAVIGFVFVFLHRSVWVFEAWDFSLALRSWALSFCVVVAWGVRLRGQGRLFVRALRDAQEVMGLESEVLSDFPQSPSWSGVGAGYLCLGVALPLLFACILPGVAVLAVTLCLPAILVAEDRDWFSALRRSLRIGLRNWVAALGSVLFFGGVHFLTWVVAVGSAPLGLFLVSSFFGVDVGRLDTVFRLTNVSFVLGCGILAWLVLEPFWLLQRSVLYLDGVLGSSGADLKSSWKRIQRLRGASTLVLAVLSLFVVLAVGNVPTASAMPTPKAGEELIPITPDAASVGGTPLETYASRLEELAKSLEFELDQHEKKGECDLTLLEALLVVDSFWSFEQQEGETLEVDLSAVLRDFPSGIESDDDRVRLEILLNQLRESAAFARMLARPQQPAALESSEENLRGLLSDELEREGYSLTTRTRETRPETQSAFKRFIEWLEKLLEEPEVERSEVPTEVDFQLPMKWIVGSVLFVLAVFGVFLAVASRRSAEVHHDSPLDRLEENEGTLPDARSRSVESWSSLAEELAERGEYRSAIRALFLAVLARLEQLREIDYRPSASNREHLRSFSGTEGRREYFVLAMLTFELAWFGGRSVLAGDWQRMYQGCSSLVEDPVSGGNAGS